MHVITQSLKQLTQALVVYGFLIFGYSQVSDAAYCGDFGTAYLSLTNGGANNTVFSLFKRSTSSADPANCSVWMMSGDEYANLIKARIDTANINISTLQSNNITLQNNQQTLNTSLQAVSDMATDTKSKLEVLQAYVDTHAMRDSDNILHINHDDALTLFYAVMGLLVTAGVWRYARSSLVVGDTHYSAE